MRPILSGPRDAAVAVDRPVRIRWATVLERLALPLMLALVIVIFSVARPETFPTMDNARSILSSQSVLAVLAVGAVVPFVTGQFDLSLPSVLGLTQIVAAALMADAGVPLAFAIVIAIAIGATVGVVNGVVVSALGVNSIITTLGTASLIQGVSLWVTKGNTVTTGISPRLLEFGSTNWLGIPKPAYCVLAAALTVSYLLTQTPLGRALEAFGTNPRGARLIGLRERRLTGVAFVIAGSIAGAAGVLQVATSGSASPTFGPGLLLTMLTAVFLGATTIRPGRYSVSGTLLAMAFLAISLSGLTLVSAPDYVEPIYTGIALIIAVAISTVVRRRRSGALP